MAKYYNEDMSVRMKQRAVFKSFWLQEMWCRRTWNDEWKKFM